MKGMLSLFLGLLLFCAGCGQSVPAETALPDETAAPGQEFTPAEASAETLYFSPVETGEGWVCYYKEEPLEDGLHHRDTLSFVPERPYDCVKVTAHNDGTSELRVTCYLGEDVLVPTCSIPPGETGEVWLTEVREGLCYDVVFAAKDGYTLSGRASITAGNFEALGYQEEGEIAP